MMIAALLGATAFAAPLDGEDIYRAAESELAKLGFRGPRRLVVLDQFPTSTWGYPSKTYWSVSYNRPGTKKFIMMNLSPSGRIYTFYNTYGKDSDWPARSTNRFDKVRARFLAQHLLDRFDHHECRFDSIGQGEHILSASFDLVVNGRLFFNLNPHYGYTLSWDPATQEVDTFMSNEVIPPLNSTRPKITQEAARRAFLTYARSSPASDGTAQMLVRPPLPMKSELRVELGYFHWKNERDARLVWHATVGSRYQGVYQQTGPLMVLVDAQTGKLIAPDDQGLR